MSGIINIILLPLAIYEWIKDWIKFLLRRV